MDLLERSMNQYTEIEEFELYEKTNCIAFEMAIRNNEVLNIMELLYEPQYCKNFVSNDLWSSDFVKLCKETSQLEYEKLLVNSKIELACKKILNEYCFPILISYNLNYYSFSKYFNLEHNNVQWFTSVLKFLYLEYGERRQSLAMVTKHVQEDGFYVESMTSKIAYKYFSGNKDLEDESEEKINQFMNSNSNVIERESKSDIDDCLHYVRNHFRRPLLNSPRKFNINLITIINPRLPRKEIIAYVNHILDNNETNVEMAIPPASLGDYEFIKDKKNLLKYRIDQEDDPFDKVDVKTISNLFYIYDAKKLGIETKIIIDRLEHYHNRPDSLKAKKIENDFNFMKFYIDNFNYKELVFLNKYSTIL